MSSRPHNTGRTVEEDREPKSWAKSIQAYQHDKKHLAWNPTDIPPPTFVKQYDVSRKDREMDPILMRHRDPSVEGERQEREKARLRQTLNIARTRQLSKERNYDIVKHTSHLKETEEPVLRLTRQPDSRTPYNILNHVPREDACSSALIYSDRELPKVMPPKALSVEGEKKPRSHMRRDVDILSNSGNSNRLESDDGRRRNIQGFLEKHDERVAEEENFLRGKAQEGFRRTHDYNPITGTYYDKAKEENFVQSRAKLESLQGQAQQKRLPPSIRYGEGNGYDIINKQPKGLANNNRVGERGLNKCVHGREEFEKNVRRHELERERAEQRMLNRSSHTRHAEVLRTGYDIISNQVFTGREGRPPPRPHARPPVPAWGWISGPDTRGPEQEASACRPDDGGTRCDANGGGGAMVDARHQKNETPHGESNFFRGGDNEADEATVKRDRRRWEGAIRGHDDGDSAIAVSRTKPTVPMLDLPMKSGTVDK